MHTILFITSMLCSNLLCTKSAVITWTVDTTSKPQFNKDVRLNCTVTGAPSCCSSQTREWSIHVNGVRTVILRNGSPGVGFVNKYKEELEAASNQFNLVIHNFSLSDFQIYYQCLYGFDFDRQLLTDVTFLPTKNDVHILTQDFGSSVFSFAANITNVNPVPAECSATYGDTDVSSSLVNESSPNGNLWSTLLNMSEVAHECRMTFTVRCTIGPFMENIIELYPKCITTTTAYQTTFTLQTIEATSKRTKTVTSPSWLDRNKIYVGAGCGVVAVLLFIICLSCIYRNRRSSNNISKTESRYDNNKQTTRNENKLI